MAKNSHSLISSDDPFWSLLSGYNTGEIPENDTEFLLTSTGISLGNNKSIGLPKNANGQFASIPGISPKYLRHLPGVNREGFGTLARMLVRVKNVDAARRIAESLRDSVSKDVAQTLLGDGKSGALGYIDFFLENIQAGHAEKVQVTEVLEDNYVAFFFGSQPPTYSFSGSLMNTLQDDWAVQMFSAYQDIFRGTQLARRGLLLYVRFDSYMVAGAVTSMTMQRMAANETAIPFNFQMLVHKIHRMFDPAYGATRIPADGYDTFDPEDANSFVPARPQALKPRFAAAKPDAINTEEMKKANATAVSYSKAVQEAASKIVESAKIATGAGAISGTETVEQQAARQQADKATASPPADDVVIAGL